MTNDLEKKVLRETGLSGMAIGAVAGAVAGGLAMGVLGKLAGASDEQVKRLAIGGAVAGGVGGGFAGYGKGQAEGKKIVSKSMDRDQYNKLITGARQKNQHLASINSNLRQQLAKARQNPDPKQRKLAYASLRSDANRGLREMNDTIKDRDDALSNAAWGSSSQKGTYRARRNELVAQRDEMVASVNLIAKLDQATVY